MFTCAYTIANGSVELRLAYAATRSAGERSGLVTKRGSAKNSSGCATTVLALSISPNTTRKAKLSVAALSEGCFSSSCPVVPNRGATILSGVAQATRTTPVKIGL